MNSGTRQLSTSRPQLAVVVIPLWSGGGMRGRAAASLTAPGLSGLPGGHRHDGRSWPLTWVEVHPAVPCRPGYADSPDPPSPAVTSPETVAVTASGRPITV